MEKLCLKVRKDDLGLLKRMIDPVKEEASAATAEFLQLHLESVEELKINLMMKKLFYSLL